MKSSQIASDGCTYEEVVVRTLRRDAFRRNGTGTACFANEGAASGSPAQLDPRHAAKDAQPGPIAFYSAIRAQSKRRRVRATGESWSDSALLYSRLRVFHIPARRGDISWTRPPMDRADFARKKSSAPSWMGPSVSAATISAATIPAIVELYPDVDAEDGRAIAIDTGLRILEIPICCPIICWCAAPGSRCWRWRIGTRSPIFPASRDLLNGTPVHACAGAFTSQGTVSQAIPLIGDGWDGPGLGSASLTYVFQTVTASFPPGRRNPRSRARSQNGPNMSRSLSRQARTQPEIGRLAYSLPQERTAMGIHF